MNDLYIVRPTPKVKRELTKILRFVMEIYDIYINVKLPLHNYFL